MPEHFDESDFVDQDFQASERSSSSRSSSTSSTSKASQATGSGATSASKAPSMEELDHQVTTAQQKLTELRRAQEELERERAQLEESRRRQHEFQTGRDEMVHNLTRGVELLGEAEFAARQEAEQMAKTLKGLRDSLGKLQSIQEDEWSQESYENELTKALSSIENARMEWNAAQLKWPILTDPENKPSGDRGQATDSEGQLKWLSDQNLRQLCKVGLALTWPLALVALIAVSLLLFILILRGG